MTVPKGKRSLSDMQFYKNAITLRLRISEFLLRDFGVKPKVRSLQNLKDIHKMSDEDAKALSDLMDRYNLGDRVIEEFPEWWIDQHRKEIDKILTDLLLAIRKANAIYPQTMPEYEERRLYQTKAICAIDCLTEELSFAVALLNRKIGIDINRLEPYLKLIEEEYVLLKAWRKSDNKIRNRILKGSD